MKFKSSLNFDIKSNTMYVRVDFYRTEEAYLYPEEAKENEILNCCTAVDLEQDRIKAINQVMRIIDMSLESLLSYKPDNERENV